MKRVFGGMIAGLMAIVCAVAQQPIYINNDNRDCITNAPQIDATIFVNNGSLCYDLGVLGFSALPFTTQNTKYVTNNGALIGSSGFWFDYAPSSGLRQPLESFINTRRGVIDATDPSPGIIFSADDISALNPILGSYIIARGKQLVNQGTLSIGAAGMLQLKGDTVTLANSALNVKPLQDSSILSGFFFNFSSWTNFVPDPGIYDNFWGLEQNTNFNVRTFVSGAGNFLGVTTPPTRVTNEFGGFGQTVFSLTGPLAVGRGIQTSPTNVTIQAIFVQTADPRITARARWSPFLYNADAGGANNSFLTPIVELSSVATNVTTGNAFTNTLYVIDELGSATNATISTNVSAYTLRPGNFILSRGQPFGFVPGVPGNIPVTPGLFYNTTYSNAIVTNIQAAYSADVDSIARRLPLVPGASVTNLPGRIEIFAESLNMNRTRVRAEGILKVQANDFQGSTNSALDSPTFSYNLAKASGPLILTNIAPKIVDRFHGTVGCWSGSWTNQQTDFTTSNVTTIEFQVLVVDATAMLATQPVRVTDLIVRNTSNSTQSQISDDLTVTENIRIDSSTFTVSGSLDITSNPLIRWNDETFPNLTVFTNRGTIAANGLADFGASRSSGYSKFFNSGRISAFSTLVQADEFENAGAIVSSQPFTFGLGGFFGLTNFFFTNFFTDTIGPIEVRANSAKLQGGSFRTLGDVKVTAAVTKLDNYSTEAGGAVRFEIGTSLNDSGPDARNTIVANDGFHFTKTSGTVNGDLFGTTFTVNSPRFNQVESSWAAQNRGATTNGFINNQVIGHLVLNFADPTSAFLFSPEGSGTALYVDLLELNGFVPSDITSGIEIAPGFEIYFADLKINSAGSTLTVTNFDNVLFGSGRMHWVPFAGPNSSVDVALSETQSTTVNRLLRESLLIDSDGDGIPNGADEFPFTAAPNVRLAAQVTPLGVVTMSWTASARTTYRLEFSDSLTKPNWTLVQQFTNSGSASTVMNIPISETRTRKAGYYRLGISH